MTHRTFATVEQAFATTPWPRANLPLVVHVAETVGIAEVTRMSGYLRLTRRDGTGPALQVHSGYTNGFVSEEEARRAGGDLTAKVWPSGRGTDLWGIDHPVSGHAWAPGDRPGDRRPATFCSVHHVALPATGLCDDCD